jgi:hypothetical protein
LPPPLSPQFSVNIMTAVKTAAIAVLRALRAMPLRVFLTLFILNLRFVGLVKRKLFLL